MSILNVLTLKDKKLWAEVVQSLPEYDISALPSYCEVFQNNGDGEALCFFYTEKLGKVVYPVFLRKLNSIPFLENLNEEYFDLTTPYGYGGMYTDCQPSDVKMLLKSFRKKLEKYALKKNIISEFVRFHPLLNTHDSIEEYIDDLKFHSSNVLIDLTITDEEILKSCRERFRTYIRQTNNLGVKIERVCGEKILNEFIQLYKKSMERYQNTGYLNFPSSMFVDLFKNLNDNAEMFTIRCKGKIVSAAIILKQNNFIDYFLAANERTKTVPYASHFLIYKVSCWAKKNGFKWMHLGGGSENLMQFKSGFSKLRCNYYIGKHIFNKSLYQSFVKKGVESGFIPNPIPLSFFPNYRAYRSNNSDRSLLDQINSDGSNESPSITALVGRNKNR